MLKVAHENQGLIHLYNELRRHFDLRTTATPPTHKNTQGDYFCTRSTHHTDISIKDLVQNGLVIDRSSERNYEFLTKNHIIMIEIKPNFCEWLVHHENPQVIMPGFAFTLDGQTFTTNVDSDYEV